MGPSYFDGRAIELISNAGKMLNDPKIATDVNKYRDYDSLMVQAMQMILLARAIRGSYLANKQQEKIITLTQDGLELSNTPFVRIQVPAKSIECQNPNMPKKQPEAASFCSGGDGSGH